MFRSVNFVCQKTFQLIHNWVYLSVCQCITYYKHQHKFISTKKIICPLRYQTYWRDTGQPWETRVDYDTTHISPLRQNVSQRFTKDNNIPVLIYIYRGSVMLWKDIHNIYSLKIYFRDLNVIIITIPLQGCHQIAGLWQH